MKHICITAGIVALACGLLAAQTTSAPASRPAANAPVRPAACFALIIGGLGDRPAKPEDLGKSPYSRNILDWVSRFEAVLTKAGVKSENLIVLTERGDDKAQPPRPQSTLDNVKKAFGQLKDNLQAGDQLVIVLVGHGQVNEPVGKFCLVGQDLTATELTNFLEKQPATNVALINCASGGAAMIRTAAAPGRVIISAAGDDRDGNQTYFAEFFLSGYETGKADLDGDGIITLLEAYAYAARATANFYHRQYLLTDAETREPSDPLEWDVRGKETRKVWRKLYEGTSNKLGQPKEGTAAARDSEADDEPVFGEYNKAWVGRRLLAEHARLDDTDGKTGFFLWKPYEFVPLPKVAPGQEGYTAARTVLGRPTRLPAPASQPTK